jgi:hypothetical protein
LKFLPFLCACGLLYSQSTTPDPPSADSQNVASQNLDPENLHERWDSYLQKTYSWKKISQVTAETAFDQTFQLNKCGRPPYCFPHEIGKALTRRTARTTMELGVGALLHEDLRRRPSNLSGFRQRLSYALLHAPLAKGPNGEWRPAYSRFAGSIGAVAVSTAWDGRPLTAARLSQGFGFTTTSYLQDALWTEFEPDLKHLAHRLADRLKRPHPAATPLISASPAIP